MVTSQLTDLQKNTLVSVLTRQEKTPATAPATLPQASQKWVYISSLCRCFSSLEEIGSAS